MPWTRPDFVEISLSMEVTAYVNTDESVGSGQPPVEVVRGAAAPPVTSPRPLTSDR